MHGLHGKVAMSSDALLKALPGSPPWLIVLILFAFAVVLIERIVRLTNDFTSRRSDHQLLEQADKAASILEKLPDGHRSRSDLLTYISHGPIFELSRRQTDRLKRRQELIIRQQRRSRTIGAFIITSIILALLTEELIVGWAEIWRQEGMGFSGRLLLVIAATVFLFVIFSVLFLVLYGLHFVSDKIVDVVAHRIVLLRTKVINRRQEKKGRGGVYEI